MLEFFREKELTDYDVLIEAVITEMQVNGPDAPEYPEYLEYLQKLNELNGKSPKKSIDPNTLLQVGGSIASVLIIVMYEQKHVITTKALGFIRLLK